MVGSSKILTVSYGTFSCTLEGFDQPFDTMKSIAEYFRDLAADDRYFGAEPPQPDAQMLHQIAEREVKRRVEARVEKNGVVLRQTADATAGSAAGFPLTRPAVPTQAPRRASPPGDDRRPSPARSDAGDNTPFEVEIDGDSVAAKLSRIRAVVARARASREADTAFAEDEPVEPYVAPVRSDFFVADAPVIDDAEEADDFAVEAATVPADDAESPVSLSDMIDDAGLDESADPTETLAEAFDIAEPDAPEDVSTPKVTIAEISVTEVSMTEVAITDVSDTWTADPALETAPLVDETAAEDFADEPKDDTGQILASVLAETADNASELVAATPDSMTIPDVETIETAAQEYELPAHTDAESDIVAKIAEPEDLESQFDDNLRDALDDTIAGLVGDSEPEEALTATPSVPSAPHARIIKLKRTEFEAALASGEIEEVEDDDDLSDTEDMFAEIELDADEPTDAIADTGTMATHDDPTVRDKLLTENVFAADTDTDEDDFDNIGAADDTLTDGIRNLIGETSLDEEDENDLLAELAAVERAETETANPTRAPHPLADANFDETPAVAEEAPVEQDEAQGDEQALNRLLTETNAKLNDTEGSRRRSAIAHLKAAVAATKADKLLKGQAEKVKDETLIQYRDDLAQVVRPRRPVAGGQTGEGAARERPADPLAARPAPLVLVSEQRIDRPTEPKAPVGSVRPRRVSRPQVASAESLPASDRKGNAAISFADFSEQRGASDLPDILEAAAAYAALTEGQTEISRPELLRRVATLRPDLKLSREKGLQSFGQLLRTGRIRKVGQGQFALSNQAQPSQSRVSAG